MNELRTKTSNTGHPQEPGLGHGRKIMRYLVTMLAAVAILFSLAVFTPSQAQAGQNDGIRNRIILVDSRGHRSHDRWDRRDHRRDHRRDRRWDRRDHRRDWRDERESYYYWQHNRHRHHNRPYFSGRNSQGFYWWEVPGPLPLFIPLPR